MEKTIQNATEARENKRALLSHPPIVVFEPQPENTSLIQMNGRKVLGPPEDWVGPPPSNSCELYIRRIPREMDEQELIKPFLRFGRIYEIRVPIEYNNFLRGFAYVKYTNEEEAARAIEVLTHFFVGPGRKFDIMYSYEKCRLFVSNIPRHLTECEIGEKFRTIFPTMVRVCLHSGTGRGSNNAESTFANRGYVFVHFASHVDALAAKKNITPGIIRLWDRDLKVVWADEERDNIVSPSVKTIFIRNVDLTVNNRDLMDLLVKYVPRSVVRKMSKVRTSCFVDFTTRDAAETCLRELQGIFLRGMRLEVEWAKPSESQSLHRIRTIDFDGMLRLKCMANGWSVPVVLFGTYFSADSLQYATVMLRSDKGIVKAIYCILQPPDLNDIHSRICEIVCALIETIGTFPDYNYTFFVDKEDAHLLGMVTHYANTVDFIAAHGVPNNFHFDLNEIVDLSCAVAALTDYGEDTLIAAYYDTFRNPSVCTFLPNMLVFSHRIFGTIRPKYRNKPPLNYNLNDTQIVLALCYLSTGSNLNIPSRPHVCFRACGFDIGCEMLKYVKLKLLPLPIAQCRWNSNYVLDRVVYGDDKYYHPAQRVMLRPIFSTGCSYANSIKQPPQVMEQLIPLSVPPTMVQLNGNFNSRTASIGSSSAMSSAMDITAKR